MREAITPKEWCESRIDQKLKFQNVSYITEFNKALVKFKDEFDGEVRYFYKNTDLSHHKILYYAENTPIFYLFKLSPDGFYIDNEDTNDLWKRSEIDTTILEKFNSLTTNKYLQGEQTFKDESDFILFPLQSLANKFDPKIFFDCIGWAVKNKKKIVFKLHPFHHGNVVNNSVISIKKNPKIQEYVKFVNSEYNLDDLIDKCCMVWTFNSGSGLQAILKGKPVSYFMKPYDYAPICKYSLTPEEAFNCEYNSENVKRFLSWYYHKLTLDVTHNDFENKLYERMDNYFNKDYTIDDLY